MLDFSTTRINAKDRINYETPTKKPIDENLRRQLRNRGTERERKLYDDIQPAIEQTKSIFTNLNSSSDLNSYEYIHFNLCDENHH